MDPQLVLFLLLSFSHSDEVALTLCDPKDCYGLINFNVLLLFCKNSFTCLLGISPLPVAAFFVALIKKSKVKLILWLVLQGDPYWVGFCPGEDLCRWLYESAVLGIIADVTQRTACLNEHHVEMRIILDPTSKKHLVWTEFCISNSGGYKSMEAFSQPLCLCA